MLPGAPVLGWPWPPAVSSPPPGPVTFTAIECLSTAHATRVDLMVKLEGTGSINVAMRSWSQGREFYVETSLGSVSTATAAVAINQSTFPGVAIGETVDFVFESEETDQTVTMWAVARKG